ncbi:type II toxin-antitoxin system RelE/ParE family toxin [Ochrobactrum teleogrylli]|uniref:type II toxin-antitoxin system RelE/ParE family toxin n=1 Tax=Ochrobactrum teleogrylli TaxID=2479765 RepID=UPI00384FF328
MPELEWSNPARVDLIAIIEYISDDNPDAAQRLADDIREKAAKLPEFPKMYRVGRVKGTREMNVGDNYIVIYSESPNIVKILRVLHGARQWPDDEET